MINLNEGKADHKVVNTQLKKELNEQDYPQWNIIIAILKKKEKDHEFIKQKKEDLNLNYLFDSYFWIPF